MQSIFLIFIALANLTSNLFAAEPSEVDKTLDLAHRTLVFVEAAAPRTAFAAELQALHLKADALQMQSRPDLGKLLADIRALRRRIIFSHPLLDFDSILINRNPPTTFSHNADQYLGRHSRIGDGPVVLENWKTVPKETLLLRGKLPPGAYANLNLSYDATKFLFAFADHTPNDKNLRRFFIYEAAIDGSSVRQITGTSRDALSTGKNRQTVLIEDNDPCYLPDGSIVFVSSRSQNFGRCHSGRYVPAFLLYRADANGDNIHQISWGLENECNPAILPDGRIVYTRWEYVDRHECKFHKLWVTGPDGTAPANFYGNDTLVPFMMAQTRPIPNSRKVVTVAMAHHSFTTGSLIVIDPAKGENGPEPVTRITPEIPYPESSGWSTKGSYSFPYPLSEDLFLVAYSPNIIPRQPLIPSSSSFDIYLVDTLGGRELIYRDPNVSCFSPIPIRPRDTPRILSSVLPSHPQSITGTYFIQNVNLTRNDPQGLLKPGDIKALRFIELYDKPTPNIPPFNNPVGHGMPKRILGTVPVNPDGSVAVSVPANTPMHIQALDKNGMAIVTERSFHYLQPGEVRSCVGCHESAGTAPPVSYSASSWKIQSLTPPVGSCYEGGFSFPRTVQPVLDRYCISCHGLNEPSTNKISLIGSPEQEFTRSYLALVPYTSTVGTGLNTQYHEQNISRPRDYYAIAGKLGKMILANHGKTNLDPESFSRLVDWLDLNAPCYGDFSWNRVEKRRPIPAGEKALREFIRVRFGASLADQPYDALVNVGQPDQSRILLAPLPAAAGGWGQITRNAWTGAADPAFLEARQIVLASIAPLAVHDLAGTCTRVPCPCRSCWVRLNELNTPQKTGITNP